MAVNGVVLQVYISTITQQFAYTKYNYKMGIHSKHKHAQLDKKNHAT